MMVAMLEIGEKFSLNEPINPTRKYSSSVAKKIHEHDGFILLKTKALSSQMKWPIKVGTFRVADNEQSPPNHIRKGKREELLLEGRYLAVLINIDLTLDQVALTVREAVKMAREGLQDGIILNNGERRKRLEDNDRARFALDLRKEGLTIAEIARHLFPNDLGATDKVRKIFKRSPRRLSYQ